ncbi:CDP-alcohol phosphatidyltransferase family protein [Dickeya zeae]|uniref:Phosphatidylserine synthase n=1 Tax=Dickeya zeae TaxID=204042 RepID=A0AAE6YYL2_9GAMM|nr:CDP-alcohol phosphatidyltransferase family protein [Dickeya zeae]MCO7261709.1 CDP-alcohol phosphatidyltransferase family protein [Dickeya zeae]QIZ50996.1 phosphatidylserine synthase [Dickeya zeae]QYM90788.1 phosphatidylserine synthase [Dickeya zeae]
MGAITSAFPFLKFMDLANLLTTINVGLSLSSIYLAYTDNIYLSSIALCSAAVLDFLDGYIARTWLTEKKQNREFGKQLDSLADLLNFSVAPALIIFHIIPGWASFASGMMLLLSGCLRLSLFSVISGSHPGSYRGLPTTYAGVIYSLFFQLVAYNKVALPYLIWLNLFIALIQIINVRIPKYAALPTISVFLILFVAVRVFISL